MPLIIFTNNPPQDPIDKTDLLLIIPLYQGIDDHDQATDPLNDQYGEHQLPMLDPQHPILHVDHDQVQQEEVEHGGQPELQPEVLVRG
jgi:hypothetical protein